MMGISERIQKTVGRMRVFVRMMLLTIAETTMATIARMILVAIVKKNLVRIVEEPSYSLRRRPRLRRVRQ